MDGRYGYPELIEEALKRKLEVASSSYGEDVNNFVQRNFYVDDALTFMPTKEESIALLSRTTDAFMTLGQIRLHKFASNDGEYMKNLPSEDLAKEFKGNQPYFGKLTCAAKSRTLLGP